MKEQPRVTTGTRPTMVQLQDGETWICPGCNHTFINTKYDPICFHCADPLGTDIWKQFEQYEGKPHGRIQWKGTNVCMDVHCKCGAHLHIDSDFVYYIQCPHCETCYAVNGHVQLVELTEAQKQEALKLSSLHILEKEED